jgi:hypothetical protein
MLPKAPSDVQPVLAIVGLIVDYDKLHDLTLDFLHLKRHFFPNLSAENTTYLGRILDEVKGSDIRRDFCVSKRRRRAATRFTNGVIGLIEHANARVVGRVWVKSPGESFNGRSVYSTSLQHTARYFHDYLARTNDLGVIVCDSRTASLNAQMSHSIFTQKFRASGDAYDRIIDLPTFGHSRNHAGLQVADILCSAVVWPMAIHTYCEGILNSQHVRPGYKLIKQNYVNRLSALQHRFQEANGKWRGGLVVSDALSKRPGKLLFDDSGLIPANDAGDGPLFEIAAASSPPTRG